MAWTGPIFPVLPGLEYPVKQSPTFNTVKQDALSGRRIRYALYSFPTYSYELSFSVLRSGVGFAEWQTLIGFIKSVYGPALLFGYDDPNDDGVSGQEFGVGDGSTTQFQLVRTLGGFTEPVFLINGTPTINVAGTPTVAYVISATGLITFTTAPTSGQSLTWSGSYYWPCRFDDDATGFSNFMSGLFELKSLKFSTEKLSTTTGGSGPPSGGVSSFYLYGFGSAGGGPGPGPSSGGGEEYFIYGF